jgi:hypothetical protein
LKKNYFSSHKLPKQQSTSFWSQGILGVNLRYGGHMRLDYNILEGAYVCHPLGSFWSFWSGCKRNSQWLHHILNNSEFFIISVNHNEGHHGRWKSFVFLKTNKDHYPMVIDVELISAIRCSIFFNWSKNIEQIYKCHTVDKIYLINLA